MRKVASSPARLTPDRAGAKAADNIVESAAQLFVSEGFDQVSMDDVAALVGVSRATIYRRFASRDQLIGAVLLARVRPFLRRIDALPLEEAGFAAQLEAAFVIGVLELPKDPVLAALVAMGGAGRALVSQTQRVREAIGDTMRPLLDRARVAGELLPELSTDEIIAWLLRQQFGLIESGPWTVEDLRHQVRTFVLPALVTPTTPPGGLESRLARIEALLEELTADR